MSDHSLSPTSSIEHGTEPHDAHLQPVAFQPPQRKQTLLRRFSESTFGSGDDADEISLRSGLYEGRIQNEEDRVADLFTARALVARSLTAAPDDEETIASAPPPPRKESVSSVGEGVSFFDKSLHEFRIKMIFGFLLNYVYLIVGFVAVQTIYWGTYYDRTSKFKNLAFGVLIADVEVAGVPPVIGPIVQNFFEDFDAVKPFGNYEVYNYTEFLNLATSHNNSLEAEVKRQLHHQKKWGMYFVPPNTTLKMVQEMQNHTRTLQMDQFMHAYYETGRDYNAVMFYITTLMHIQVKIFNQFMDQAPWLSLLTSTLTDAQKGNLIRRNPNFVTSAPTFKVQDLIPVPDLVVQAPLQVGTLYLVVFAFFQFLFMLKVHMMVAQKIKGLKYVAYRICVSQSAYLVLSLSFVVLNAAFGMSFTKTFGRSGFLVIWMFSFLMMSALGSSIEVMVTIIAGIKMQFIGYVMIFTSVFNLAVTISPIVLCNNFYRYGFAMPLYNAYHLMNISYFDSYKGFAGRYIGVLIVWIVVSNACLPFALKFMASRMAHIRAEAAKR